MEKKSKLEKMADDNNPLEHSVEVFYGMVLGIDPIGIAVGAGAKILKKDFRTFSFHGLTYDNKFFHPLRLFGLYCGLATSYQVPTVPLVTGALYGAFSLCGHFVRKRKERKKS